MYRAKHRFTDFRDNSDLGFAIGCDYGLNWHVDPGTCVATQLDEKTPDIQIPTFLCPIGESNSCFGLERATSWAARRMGLAHDSS